MKEFVTKMMNGWLIYEASYNIEKERYEKSEETSMIEAFDGDETLGYLAVLFSHYSNDIQSVAANAYLIAIKDGKVVDIEPPPVTGKYWYDLTDHVWREIEEISHHP